MSPFEQRGYDQAYRRLVQTGPDQGSIRRENNPLAFSMDWTMFWGYLSIACWVIVLICLLFGYSPWGLK